MYATLACMVFVHTDLHQRGPSTAPRGGGVARARKFRVRVPGTAATPIEISSSASSITTTLPSLTSFDAGTTGDVAVDTDNHDSDTAAQLGACQICVGQPVGVVFVPCGHARCCLICALQLYESPGRQCPYCRQTISSVLNIYI